MMNIGNISTRANLLIDSELHFVLGGVFFTRLTTKFNIYK